MSRGIIVGMADLNIGKAPDIITTVGLGSCIGLTLYDPVTRVGGLVHYMLPDSKAVSNNSNIAKFCDTGVQELLKRVTMAGANRRRLVAKIAGGAKMFAVNQESNVGSVGERNTVAAKQILRQLGIQLIAEDTGLNFGRTVELHCDTGDFYIKAVKKTGKDHMIKELCRDFSTVIKKHGNPSAIVVVVLLMSVVLAEMLSGIGCPIHYMTGINCPGCGMSRALLRVLHFDIKGAFLFHPLWWLLPVLAVVWILRESGRISRKIYDRFLWIFCILFLVVYFFRLLDPADGIVRAVPGEGLIFRLFSSIL